MDDPGVIVQPYAGGKPAEVANALTRRQGQRQPSRLDMTNVVLAVHLKQDPINGAVSPTLSTMERGIAVGAWVRRFTPIECERLMGWPDDHTATGLTADGKEVAISHTRRGHMAGNGCATPVARFIAEQIKEVT